MLHIELFSAVQPWEPKPEIFARVVNRTIVDPDDSEKKATSIFKGDGGETPMQVESSSP